MEYGDMSLNGINPEETVAGMHSIIFNILKELTKLEDENMIITECHVQLKFIEGPGIQEYQQIQDGTTNIIIDKTSLEEAKKYIDQQKACRPLISILSEYGDPEQSRWLSNDEFYEFSAKFTKMHDSIFGQLDSFDPEDSGEIYYDHYDINEILKEKHIPWKVRHVAGLNEFPYAITRID